MNVTLTAGPAGQRADQFLAAALDGLTRSAALTEQTSCPRRFSRSFPSARPSP